MRRLLAATVSVALAGAALAPMRVGASPTPPAPATTPGPTSGTIVNGVAWHDTYGNYITAHLGSSFHVGSTYYWCGAPWNTTDHDTEADHGFFGIRCYSSANLVDWTDEGIALAVDPANPMLRSDRHIERPKVVYNSATQRYVMWFHDDQPGYGQWANGVATATSPTGPYTWVADSDTTGFRGCGLGTGDMTLYQEGSAAYFVHTTQNNADVVIQQLSDDYLQCATGPQVANGLGGGEAPQLVRVNGTYFLFESHANWWAPSQGFYRTATSLHGPWSAAATFGTGITADSQGDDIIAVQGSLGTTYVMMADRLQGAGSNHHWNVNQSQYVWLPLSFRGNTVRMDYRQSWSIDTATGLWSSADPQPCDLNQLIDFEIGRPDDVGGTVAPGVLTTQAGTWDVVGSVQPTGNATNKIYRHTSSEGAYSYENATDQGANTFQNYYVQSFAARSTTATEVSVDGRFSPTDHNHYYTLTLNGSGWQISLDNGGIWTTLASGPSYPLMDRPGTWYLMRLVMDGPNISGWLSTDNGVSFVKLGSTTDSTLTSGTFAVASTGGTASFDSISACVLSPGATRPPPIPTLTTISTSANPASWPGSVTFTATVTAGGAPVTTGTVNVSWPALNGGLLLPVNAQGQVHASIGTVGVGVDLSIGTTPMTATYLGTDSLAVSQAGLNQQVVYPAPVTPPVTDIGVTSTTVTLSGERFDRPPVIQALDKFGTVLATHQAVSAPHFDVLWMRPTSWPVPLPGDTVPLPAATASFRVIVPFESVVLTESLFGLGVN